MDDRNIAKNTHFDVVNRETGDGHRARGLRKEPLPVDQRAVGVRAQEILGQYLVEPPHIAVLHRIGVIAIERSQGLEIASRCGCGSVAGIGRDHCILPVARQFDLPVGILAKPVDRRNAGLAVAVRGA